VVDRADAAIGRQAERQHGLVMHAPAIEAGLTQAGIHHRLASGRWVAAASRVYRVTGATATWEARILAAVLSAGPGAVASHRTAAALWQLDGSRRGRPELAIPRGRRHRGDSVRIHRSTDLALVRPTMRLGIPTTPVARTLLDLGAVVTFEQLHLAVDDARRRRLVSWDDLVGVLVSHARRGRRGAGPLRALLSDHAAEVVATDSGFERLVIALLRSAGLPQPALQYVVEVDGRRYRLDMAYPEARVAIELDGTVHLRRDVWEADHARQNALILAGWTLLRFTWRDYTDRPSRIVTEVRRACEQAA
jgi:very-short-patch-repair endonuclease